MLTIRKLSWLALGSTFLLAGSAAAQPPGAWYANDSAPFSNARPAPKSPHTPFAPTNFDHDWQPFAPADISEYGNGIKPRHGWFGSYERLVWSISKPTTALIGDRSAEGLYYLNGAFQFARNSFDTSDLNSDFAWGNRYDIGYMDTNNKGWLVSVLNNLDKSQGRDYRSGGNILFGDPQGILGGFTDANGDSIDDDRNGNNIFGRDGTDTTVPPDGTPDVFAPPDNGDKVSFLPRFSRVITSYETKINGVELMRMYRLARFHDGSSLELYGGVRWMQVRDEFRLYGLGGFLDQFYLENTIRNDIVGPQIGGRWSMQRGRFITSFEGRFMAGFNMQNGNQNTQYASRITPPAAGTQVRNAPMYMAPHSSNASFGDTEFSPTGELRAQVSYVLTRAVALKLGYNAMVVGGISRSNNQIDYVLPNFGMNHSNTNDTLFVNGLSFGVEVNR